ncbi:hypothetical protein PORY_001333 [Pneumocystis oryctolagi]|uniref:Uncharacterized protein n=1 Tax=Pneumocystis oryctolagi TaxID=42067 RepID=A0ACB7CDX7_9ASCO|nr:hypothetical protein PORY_001333 [Pneumocystis oryctolagi]
MCIFFLGVEDFSTKIQEYENLFVYCPMCHNISVTPLYEKKFITICFVPLIPYSWGKVMQCYICSWSQSYDVYRYLSILLKLSLKYFMKILSQKFTQLQLNFNFLYSKYCLFYNRYLSMSLKHGKGKSVAHNESESVYNPLENACYTFDNGLRRVVPYFFNYKTFAKERWKGRTIYDVFSTEFRDRTPQYYEQKIKDGHVIINGRVATFEQIIKSGDVIEHLSHRHEPPVVDKKIDIIYQDDDIVVINKPPGIPVHPAGRYRHNSITHIMMAEMGFLSLAPCNRLDRLASGLMILARNVRVADEMRKKLHDRRILKEYICKVHGMFPEDEVVCVEPLLTVSPKLGLNRVHPNGKFSKSIFRRLSYDGENSIVHCQPLTGRTHQLRVHLQWLGNPIVNDPIYANVKVWGSDMGKNGAPALNNDELISSLTKMGKTEAAFWYTDKIKEAEERRKLGSGELLTGNVCDVCQAPLYSDPSQNELKIYLHAWKYKSDDGSWCFETELPDYYLLRYSNVKFNMHKNVKWYYNKMADTVPLFRFSHSLRNLSHKYVSIGSYVNINLENDFNDESPNTLFSFLTKTRKDFLKKTSINFAFILLWFIFSITLSLYNKWMFSEKYFNFKFPLFSGCIHILVEFCVSIIIMKLFPQFEPESKSFEMKDHLTKIIPCGMATSLEIGLSNISLRTITLSFYTMCKSSSLGFVLLFAFMFGLEKMSMSLVIVVVIITVGVIMMALTQTEFVFEGFFMVIIASALGGFKWTILQLLSMSNSTSFNPFSFIYILSPSIFFTLMFMSLLVEGLMNIIYSSFWDYGINAVIILVFPGVIAFCMIASEFWLIKRTSVLTLPVAGICKEVITMGASFIFFKDHFTLINIIGFVITIIGIILYNVLKYYALKEKELSQKFNNNTMHLTNANNFFPLKSHNDIEDSLK